MPCGCSAPGLGRSIAIESSVSFISRWSLRLAPSCASPTGTPAPSLRPERFAPFGSVGGIGPRLGAAKRRLGHRAVSGQPLPVDPDRLVVLQQALTPDLGEHAGTLALLKARWAELDEQIPVASSAFHCIPVLSTSKIASIASRFGTRGR